MQNTCRNDDQMSVVEKTTNSRELKFELMAWVKIVELLCIYFLTWERNWCLCRCSQISVADSGGSCPTAGVIPHRVVIPNTDRNVYGSTVFKTKY